MTKASKVRRAELDLFRSQIMNVAGAPFRDRDEVSSANARGRAGSATKVSKRIGRDASSTDSSKLEKRANQVRDRIEDVGEKIRKELEKTVGAEFQIASVRARFGLHKSFLRPLYSAPRKIKEFFLDPRSYTNDNKKKKGIFNFAESSFRDATFTPSNESSEIKLAFYDTSDLSADEKFFGNRISDFLQFMSGKKFLGKDLRKPRGGKVYCLVAGRCERPEDDVTDKDKKSSDKNKPFHDFAAFYFSPREKSELFALDKRMNKEAQEDVEDSIEELRYFLAVFFDAMRLIETRDREAFKDEGMKLIANLLPRFLSEDLAPSEKVRHLLDGLQEMLNRHLVGSLEPGDAAAGKSNEKSSARPRVYFIDVQMLVDDKNTLVPQLSLYPRSVAYNQGEYAFLLSHPKNPTLVKWLLHAYCAGKAANLNRGFARQFTKFKSEIKEPTFDNQRRRIAISSDCTGKLSDAWKELNQQLEQDKNHTTAAFILTSRWRKAKSPISRASVLDELVNKGTAPSDTDGKAVKGANDAEGGLPCGIIVFESEFPDAFSREDIDFLESFARTCEPLIQSVHRTDRSLDFRRVVRRAYRPADGRDIAGRNFGEFIFELKRLDGFVLHKVVNSKLKEIEDVTGFDKQQRIDLFGTPLKRIGEEDRNIRNWAKALEGRNITVDAIKNDLFNLWSKAGANYRERIFEFLVHIPSNAPWHSYLSSIPRAVSARSFNEDFANVTMDLYSSGFSALSIFMLSKPREIRQIIKLSTSDKIEQERSRYLDHVRYKVPLAARLPITAFAFEKSGYKKQDPEYNDDIGLGALVSDLVGGKPGTKLSSESDPFSLLDQIVLAIRQAHKKNSEVEEEKLKAAIAFHFDTNTVLWKTPPKLDWPDDIDTQMTVRVITRVDEVQKFQKKISVIEKSLTRVEESIANLKKIDKANVARAFLARLQGLHLMGAEKASSSIFSAETLDDLNRSFRRIIRYGNSEFIVPDLANLKAFHGTIHGDLNGKNLTWSSDHDKFFLIDFEHTGPGFWGVDQLRLITSTICETWPNTLATLKADWLTERKYADDRKIIHENILKGLSRVLDQLRYTSTGEDLDPLPSKGSEYIISRFFDVVFKTIDAQKSGKEKDFWRYIFVCLMFKQVDYSFREIDGKLLSFIAEILERTEKADDVFALINIACELDADADVKGRFIKLSMSFVGFLSAIAHLKGSAPVSKPD